MPIQENKKVNLTNPDCTYVYLPYHRGKATQDKNVWMISETEELDCFKTARSSKWIGDSVGWGLWYCVIFNSDTPKYIPMNLGVNFHQELLFIAKFTFNNSEWHGYPADYIRRSKNDKPDTETLTKWVDLEMITKSQMSKIKQCKPCNL